LLIQDRDHCFVNRVLYFVGYRHHGGEVYKGLGYAERFEFAEEPNSRVARLQTPIKTFKIMLKRHQVVSPKHYAKCVV